MKILILGATGMLGHRLFIELSKHHEVWGTYRDDKPLFGKPLQWLFVKDLTEGLPAYLDTVNESIPDVVINCAAGIPQRHYPTQKMIRVNAEFPHNLAHICRKIFGARLIHFSTDAVFSGKRGNYTEDDEPDGNDTYALTKRLGEISGQPHVLTLRCCPIGRELNGAHSLVEWFLAQTGEVRGYTKVFFNPITTHEIARIINDMVLDNDAYGVYNMAFGEKISKFQLLELLKDFYKHNVEIIPDDSVERDRSVNPYRFQMKHGGYYNGYLRMLEGMADDNALYEGIHA